MYSCIFFAYVVRVCVVIRLHRFLLVCGNRACAVACGYLDVACVYHDCVPLCTYYTIHLIYMDVLESPAPFSSAKGIHG